MPHKHTRKNDGDESNFNLAPTAKARPLPTHDNKAKQKGPRRPKDARRRKGQDKRRSVDGYGADDTPRAFARLMQFHSTKKRPTSLDTGESNNAKRRRLRQPTETVAQPPVAAFDRPEVPKLLPGEKLADYNARVDQAFPMGGLARKGRSNVDGVKERQTKTEKRLQKMYAAWRQEEARRKEKLEELQEEEEGDQDERQAEQGRDNAAQSSSRSSKRKRMIGESVDDDEDPWAVLKEKREAPSGLHDVVQAPPTFTKLPSEKLKVRNGAAVAVSDVPVAAGSLSRREDLSAARKEVIEQYRRMMRQGSA